MGIPRLTKYFLGCATVPTTLGQISTAVGCDKVVIDGPSLVHHIANNIEVTHGTNIPKFIEMLYNFFQALWGCGLSCHVIMDGTTPTSKHREVMKRQRGKINDYSEHVRDISKGEVISQSYSSYLYHYYLVQFLSTYANGSKLSYFIAFGEADTPAAFAAKERKAILFSTDSDHVVMDIPAYVPFKTINMKDIYPVCQSIMKSMHDHECEEFEKQEVVDRFHEFEHKMEIRKQEELSKDIKQEKVGEKDEEKDVEEDEIPADIFSMPIFYQKHPPFSAPSPEMTILFKNIPLSYVIPTDLAKQLKLPSLGEAPFLALLLGNDYIDTHDAKDLYKCFCTMAKGSKRFPKMRQGLPTPIEAAAVISAVFADYDGSRERDKESFTKYIVNELQLQKIPNPQSLLVRVLKQYHLGEEEEVSEMVLKRMKEGSMDPSWAIENEDIRENPLQEEEALIQKETQIHHDLYTSEETDPEEEREQKDSASHSDKCKRAPNTIPPALFGSEPSLPFPGSPLHEDIREALVEGRLSSVFGVILNGFLTIGPKFESPSNAILTPIQGSEERDIGESSVRSVTIDRFPCIPSSFLASYITSFIVSMCLDGICGNYVKNYASIIPNSHISDSSHSFSIPHLSTRSHYHMPKQHSWSFINRCCNVMKRPVWLPHIVQCFCEDDVTSEEKTGAFLCVMLSNIDSIRHLNPFIAPAVIVCRFWRVIGKHHPDLRPKRHDLFGLLATLVYGRKPLGYDWRADPDLEFFRQTARIETIMCECCRLHDCLARPLIGKRGFSSGMGKGKGKGKGKSGLFAHEIQVGDSLMVSCFSNFSGEIFSVWRDFIKQGNYLPIELKPMVEAILE
ncbi:Asteroid like protein [Aduncisulcus paluster]|uniref:Asteroid like protein n=1 Tax=Aduncisulcus paluster TaxID=2918883 RepID=A0ABQ5KVI9_9EUKA|nr:Asteroid like protein [Aduncisulcus paluster]